MVASRAAGVARVLAAYNSLLSYVCQKVFRDRAWQERALQFSVELCAPG